MVTQEEFISRSKLIHGDAYSYTNALYVKGRIKVKLWCNTCKCDFEITPEAHLAGQGCRTCGYARNGKNKQASFEVFVEKSRAIHENKFDYSNVVWGGNKKNITLYCTVHREEFETLPHNHVKGSGCPKCSKIIGGKKNRSNTESFVELAKLKYADKYDYSAVNYERSNNPVSVTCTIHNRQLSITPNSHLMGAGGCPDCASEATSLRCRKTTEQFIEDAQKVHGDRYSYDKTKYTRVGEPVEIYCREHGYFWQLAGSHTQGQGCSKCGNNGYKVNKPASLYVFVDKELTKIGITNKNPEIRCNFISKDSGRDFKILNIYEFKEGRTPLDIETRLLQELWKTHKSPTEKFSGFTECFYELEQETLLTRIEELIQDYTEAQNQEV